MYMTATERALGRQKTAGQVLGVGWGQGVGEGSSTHYK